MRKGCFIIWSALIVAGAGQSQGADEAISPEKKIIMGGGTGMPNAEVLNKSVTNMERRAAFDGVAIYPPVRRDEQGKVISRLGRPFRKERLRLEDFQEDLTALQTAKFSRYKYNFLWTYVTTGKKNVEVVDWFDPEFDAVIHNWKTEAEFCKKAGLVGIMFDDEIYYGRDPWTYKDAKYRDTRSAKEYADQVFRCGAGIMQAINTVYPDIQIVVLHGPSIAGPTTDASAEYGLMRHFFDGLLSECRGAARIIDGHEQAYGYRYPISYASARRMVKEDIRNLSRVPKKFDEHFQLAFSFFVGPYGTLGFSNNTAANYYTPQEFEYALHHALRYTDQYVWVYSQKCYWWDKGPKKGIGAPQAYRDSLTASRNPQPPMPLLRNLDAHAAVHPGSAKPPRKLGYPVRGCPGFEGYDEKLTFGDLWNEYQWLVDLSHLWRFRIDPNNVGVKEKWFVRAVDERSWFWITSELPWDDQGYRLYDGYGWYRQEFTAPVLPKGKKVFLAFGAVADGAEVYLNGVKVGEHNMAGWPRSPGGPWKTRFLINVTGRIRSGQKNLIAVRAVDYGRWGGGIWKPVKLIAEK